MDMITKDEIDMTKNDSVSKSLYNNTSKRNKPMILFDKVGKRYQNGVEAIKNLSFRIEEGEFAFLMGSSGAGKSTLIKLILMEERADTGRILVNSCNLDNLKKRYIQNYRRSIGVFYQDFRLLEKKTVFQNVAFAMEITGASRKEIKEKVDLTLSIMGLLAKRNEYPSHLSGGEQQRVALARAIVNGPDILIADEPTGNLDPENSAQIMNLLKMINARGTTVLVATHEQNLVEESGLRIIRLDHGKNISENSDDLEEIFENNKSQEPKKVAQHISKEANNEKISINNKIFARKIHTVKDLYSKGKKKQINQENAANEELRRVEIPIETIQKNTNAANEGENVKSFDLSFDNNTEIATESSVEKIKNDISGNSDKIQDNNKILSENMDISFKEEIVVEDNISMQAKTEKIDANHALDNAEKEEEENA